MRTTPSARRSLVAGAALLATALTGCTSTGDPTGPGEQPTPATTAPAPGEGDVVPPLTRVVSGTQGVLAKLYERQGRPEGLPIAVQAKDGAVLGVDVGTGVSVQKYQVAPGPDGLPTFRFCLVHDTGPWAAWDSQERELVIELDGDCVFTTADLPKPPKPGPRDDVSTWEERVPSRVDELLTLLSVSATQAGTALLEQDRIPEDLAAVLDVETAHPKNAFVSVAAYQRHGEGKKAQFVLCTTSEVGGWARFDSRQPDAVLASVAGDCDTEQGDLLDGTQPTSGPPSGPRPGEDDHAGENHDEGDHADDKS